MLQRLKDYINKAAAKKNDQLTDVIFHNEFFDIPDYTNLGNKLDNYAYVYSWFTFHYQYLLPEICRAHRKYFALGDRGFGEDAFHSSWFLLFQKYRPVKILEIGVYRGQTLSYFNLLGKYFNYPVDVHGISPLDETGDSVSIYEKLNYKEDIHASFLNLNLPAPNLHKGYSSDKAMQDIILGDTWDLIYIDGSHDYDVVKQDIEISLTALKDGGIMVLDDSSLYLDYIPSKHAFKGHPGTSKAADELKSSERCVNLVNVGHNRVFVKNYGGIPI